FQRGKTARELGLSRAVQDLVEDHNCVSDEEEVEENGVTVTCVVEKPERSDKVTDFVRALDRHREAQTNIRQGRARGFKGYAKGRWRKKHVRDFSQLVQAKDINLPAAGVVPMDYFKVTYFNNLPPGRRALYADSRYAALPLNMKGRDIIGTTHEFKTMDPGVFALKYGKFVLQQYQFPTKEEIVTMERENENSNNAKSRRKRAHKAAKLGAKIYGSGRGAETDSDTSSGDEDEREASRLHLAELERDLVPTHLRRRGENVLYFVDFENSYEWMRYSDGRILWQGMLHSIPFETEGDEIKFKSCFEGPNFRMLPRRGRQDVEGPFGLRAWLPRQSRSVHLYYYVNIRAGLEWYEDSKDNALMSGKHGAWRLQILKSEDKLRCNVVGFYGNEHEENEDIHSPPPAGPHPPTSPRQQSPAPNVDMDANASQHGSEDEPEVLQELKDDDGDVIYSVKQYKLDRYPDAIDIFVKWKNGYETHIAWEDDEQVIWFEGAIGAIPHKFEGDKLTYIKPENYSPDQDSTYANYVTDNGVLDNYTYQFEGDDREFGYHLDLELREEQWYVVEGSTIRKGIWGTLKTEPIDPHYLAQDKPLVLCFTAAAPGPNPATNPANPNPAPNPTPNPTPNPAQDPAPKPLRMLSMQVDKSVKNPAGPADPTGPGNPASSEMQLSEIAGNTEYEGQEIFLTVHDNYEWWYTRTGELMCEGPEGLVQWFTPLPTKVNFQNIQQGAPSHREPPLRALSDTERKAEEEIEKLRQQWSAKDGQRWSVSKAISTDGAMLWMLWCDDRNNDTWLNKRVLMSTDDEFPPEECKWQFELEGKECTRILWPKKGGERWIHVDGTIAFESSRFYDECFRWIEPGLLKIKHLPAEYAAPTLKPADPPRGDEDSHENGGRGSKDPEAPGPTAGDEDGGGGSNTPGGPGPAGNKDGGSATASLSCGGGGGSRGGRARGSGVGSRGGQAGQKSSGTSERSTTSSKRKQSNTSEQSVTSSKRKRGGALSRNTSVASNVSNASIGSRRSDRIREQKGAGRR
ncbi:hypothetical protein V5O48_018394, partial [Marasmius crinis-equi]